MTNRAMGFIGERVGGWKTRTVSTGASQEKQSFSRTNTTFMYRQSHFVSVAGLNSNLQLGYSVSGFFQGIGLRDRRADRNWAVRLAAATMGIDLSVLVGRALISHSNQALRT